MARQEGRWRTARLGWWSAFVLLLGLSTTWALTNPILSNPDEPAHAVKATALVRGQLLPPKEQLPDLGPNALIRGGFTTRVTVPTSYATQTAKSPECYIWDSRIPAGCAPAWVDDPTETEWTAYIGRYPPLYYAAVGWPTLFDTDVASFYALRLVSAIACSALLATAFALAARLPRFRLVPVGLLVAVTPEVVMMSGSVNPNALEVAAGACAWVSLAAAVLWRGPMLPARVLVPVTVSCSVLALTRPLSTMWLAVIGLAVLLLLGEPARIRARLAERDVRTTIAVVGLASLAGAAWTVFSDNLGNNRGYNPWGLGMVDAVRHSLALSWSYLQQGVAVFGWDRTPSPAPLTWAWGVALALLLVPAVRAGGRRLGLGLLGLTAFVFLMPTFLQARTARAIGFVWSGRYGLALFAGIPVIAALVLARGNRSYRGVAAAVAVITAVGHVVAHAAAMRRWMVGTDGPLNYLDGEGWDPPVDPLVLLVATALLAGALSVLAYRAAVRAPDDGSERFRPVDPAAARPG